MERSEPALVPEWLRSSGSVSSGGSTSHHPPSSSSLSDVHTRGRSSKNKGDTETTYSSSVDRSSFNNSRRDSSIGSAKHAYSSFNRGHRDRDRNKDRLSYMDPWDADSFDPLGTISASREKNRLRRSHSMVSRNQGEPLPQRVSLGLKNGGYNNHLNGNCMLPGRTIGNSFQKAGFEKDFPSLGSENRHEVPDITRVSSPGLSSAVQSLPVASSALIGGEGWTSALAEVPTVIDTSGVSSLSSPQTGAASTNILCGTSGLKMAEALVQAPPRALTPPQASVKTQRLEELAMKQSRQLIPVIASTPKGSVLNSTDKSKIKPLARTGEVGHAVSRSSQQQPSTFLNSSQSHSGGQIKSDSSKKLLILKPSWENGVTPVPKGGASPTNDNANGKAAENLLTVVPSVPIRRVNSPKERKSAGLNMNIPGITLERRPSLSQSQSRNDFFNLLKQKTSTNISTDPPGSCPSSEEKVEESNGSDSNPSSSQVVLNVADVSGKDDCGQGFQKLSQFGEKNVSFEAGVYPDEEEFAFLRSLGWEENTGEDEGLTEEEINAFYEQYKKLRPSTKLIGGMLPKLSAMKETTKGVASSDSQPNA